MTLEYNQYTKVITFVLIKLIITLCSTLKYKTIFEYYKHASRFISTFTKHVFHEIYI